MAENFEQNIQMKLSKRIYDSAEALEDAMSIYDKYAPVIFHMFLYP